MTEVKPLTDKQLRFCQEYLIDLNGSAAAVRAGYSEDSARQIASDNLSKHDIKSYISELQQQREARTRVTADRVINELAKLAFSDIRDYYDKNGNIIPVIDLDPDAAAALQSIKATKNRTGESDDKGKPIWDDVLEIKISDKKAALDLLGKHHALFTDKVDATLSGPNGGPIDMKWIVEVVEPNAEDPNPE